MNAYFSGLNFTLHINTRNMNKAKTIIVTSIIFFIAVKADAQLQNTSWKGTFLTPDPTECILKFKADTVYLRIANQSEAGDANLIETSTYKIIKDTLLLQKVSGASPCDDTIFGKYHFEMKDDKLSIALIEDYCMERGQAFPTEPLQKMQ